MKLALDTQQVCLKISNIPDLLYPLLLLDLLNTSLGNAFLGTLLERPLNLCRNLGVTTEQMSLKISPVLSTRTDECLKDVQNSSFAQVYYFQDYNIFMCFRHLSLDDVILIITVFQREQS